MGEPTYKPDDVKDALRPVALPMPEAPAPKPAVAIDDRTPTTGEILDPVRPSLQGADTHDVVDAVTDLVKGLYDDILLPALVELRPELAKVSPPQDHDGWVLKLMVIAAEAVSSALLGKLGGVAASKLFGAGEAAGEAAEASVAQEIAADASKDGGKAAGKQIGAAVEEHLGSADGEKDSDGRRAFSGPIVDEFVGMQRTYLVVKKADAIDRLRLLRARAAHVNGASMAALDENLKDMLLHSDIQQWYRTKVTLEWINLVARLSLGRRPRGQATNLPGANASGGWHDAGARGTAQWRGPHDGFIDVTVGVDASGTASFVDAQLTNRPGAAEILRGMGGEAQASGASMTLEALPAFRRIWLSSGDTKLDTNPAFVITPEGALEVNYDDPVLARVGGARGLECASPHDAYDGRDPVARTQRAARASYAIVGAEKIMTLLARQDVEKVR
jgi:hypothetical protein